MILKFQSIDRFLLSIEKEIMDILFDYNLLEKFSPSAKKILFYVLVKRISDQLKDPDLYFHHGGRISEDHELCKYFDPDKLNEFINRICHRIKDTTNRLFFINHRVILPTETLLQELDGSVMDQILLLKEKTPVSPRDLRKFLDRHHLKNLFESLSVKIC